MHAKIAEAIGKDSSTFSANGKEIIFSGDGGVTEMDIEPRVFSSINEKFYCTYWKDVVKFLKNIPEQPIVVELNYNSVEINCVAIFRTADESE